MRTWKVLALGLLLTASAAGCGGPTGDDGGVASVGGTPTASSNATTSKERDEDAPLKFSQCMREQGLTWFPDPKPGGGLQIKIPQGTDKAKVDAAMVACKEWAPDGGQDGPADPERLERARQLAQCMRDNGIKNFPDPRPDGSIHVDGSKVGAGPGDPSFDKAEQACSKFAPGGGPEKQGEGE
ncbi:hypothetical protein [Actinoplanes friuliensis]|uniref:Lipoprotein n=1 Tax=Actinoplanes friuliensis DSM 7358 TaxID=1246995 RepID=U5VSE1_9ACTN|nr:hypothetical protein [Actinoplanes friuliensis]AGZ39732.1 hypothetical protein AFR_07215 [Actinoplanes friuliensis DSM 7358]